MRGVRSKATVRPHLTHSWVNLRPFSTEPDGRMFMFTAHERRLVAFYLDNFASRLSHRDSNAPELPHWLSDHRDVLPSVCRDMPVADLEGRRDSSLTDEERRGVQAIASRARDATKSPRRDAPLHDGWGNLGRNCGSPGWIS